MISIIIIVKHSDDALYKKWFYVQKQDYYSNEIIKYRESPLYYFFEDASKSNTAPIFNYLKNPNQYDGIAQSFIIHFINAFLPISLLDKNELEEELGINETAIKNLSYERTRYPFSINQAIEKAKLFM